MQNKTDCRKPTTPPSNFAVTGCYVLDKTAPEKAKTLTKSRRGELEIVDVLNLYLREKQLAHHKFNRGVAWLDTGTPESLLEAALLLKQSKKDKVIKLLVWRKLLSKIHGWIALL